ADSGLVEAAAHELTNSAGDGDSEDIVIPTLAETGAKTLKCKTVRDFSSGREFREHDWRIDQYDCCGLTSPNTIFAATSSTHTTWKTSQFAS
ncbi:hypothetical protein KCU80_g22697, partial [Aureobasidium melanogenum]